MMTATPEGKAQNNQGKPGVTDGIEVQFYTDPLCCWSWAIDPHWRRLQEENPGLRVTYKMIGLLPSWEVFHDSVHSLRKPLHMGPEWVHAREVSGMPVNDRIWIDDPPASSFPACIAVKCAEDQSPEYGAQYLHLVRRAVMAEGQNIARMPVLLDLAATLAGQEPYFDGFAFRAALLDGRGREWFRRDYQEAQYLGIRRSPTLVFRRGGSTVMLQGYTTFEGLRSALDRI